MSHKGRSEREIHLPANLPLERKDCQDHQNFEELVQDGEAEDEDSISSKRRRRRRESLPSEKMFSWDRF